MPEVKNVKKPQDRLPKKDAPREVVVQGVSLEIDPLVFDDFEVVDALDQLQDGNGLKVATLLRKILKTPEQFAKVMDALRDGEGGRVPVDKASDFVTELMDRAAPNS